MSLDKSYKNLQKYRENCEIGRRLTDTKYDFKMSNKHQTQQLFSETALKQHKIQLITVIFLFQAFLLLTVKLKLSIYKFGFSVFLFVCLFVCLFVFNKRQNGWTDRAQIFCGTSIWKYYELFLFLFYTIQREDAHR